MGYSKTSSGFTSEPNKTPFGCSRREDSELESASEKSVGIV